jgi:hypothetical protein
VITSISTLIYTQQMTVTVLYKIIDGDCFNTQSMTVTSFFYTQQVTVNVLCNINMDCKWDTRLSIFNKASLNNCSQYFINILIYLDLRVSNTSDKFLRVRSFKWMLYACLLCKDSHLHWLCIENARRQWLLTATVLIHSQWRWLAFFIHSK